MSFSPTAFAEYSSNNALTARVRVIASGLDESIVGIDQIFPTELVPFPDGSGRMLVGTLGGAIRLIDANDSLRRSLYHDTTTAVTLNAENGNSSFGMTTLVFHPDFAKPEAAGFGKFYTVEPERTQFSPLPDFPGAAADRDIDAAGNPTGPQPAHDRVLYEYTTSDLASDVFSGSKREVVRIHEFRNGHDIGDMAFDGNGYLYISSGDNVSTATAQDIGNVFGTILRIDPLDPASTSSSVNPTSANGKYRIPADNPWIDEPGAVDEIFAMGLRSPYRLSVDSVTNELWVTSNGAGSRESVYRTSAGDNHGWHYFEGTLPRQTPAAGFDYVPPVFEYDHSLGVSVNGAFVYRGELMPELVGKVVFADFLGAGGSGARLFYGDPQTQQFSDIVPAAVGDNLPATIVSIGEDAQGELLLLSTDGTISRLLSVVIAGDFNGDDVVDDSDLHVWQAHFGTTVGASPTAGDANEDGHVNGGDFLVWQRRLATDYSSGLHAVPEPRNSGAVLLGGLLLCRCLIKSSFPGYSRIKGYSSPAAVG